MNPDHPQSSLPGGILTVGVVRQTIPIPAAEGAAVNEGRCQGAAWAVPAEVPSSGGWNGVPMSKRSDWHQTTPAVALAEVQAASSARDRGDPAQAVPQPAALPSAPAGTLLRVLGVGFGF